VNNPSLAPDQIKALLAAAHEAYQHSYVPYSKFPVGAALLTFPDAEGKTAVIKGCNIENASFGLAICAERVAITKAVSEGHRAFQAMAITAKYTSPCFCCGTCLQFIREFGAEIDVLFEQPDGGILHYKIGEMLPYAFTKDDLVTEEGAS
jgi:cytidine deaminase